jgi:hypothetical protein
MKVSLKTICFLILTIGLCVPVRGQSAKRSAPKDVPPVVFEGVRYEAAHWVVVKRKRIAGGYVEAFDVKTNKKLWSVKVYSTEYASGLERDVQEVFITSMAIENGKLVVVNERDETYDVDLKTHRVTKAPRAPATQIAPPVRTGECYESSNVRTIQHSKEARLF